MARITFNNVTSYTPKPTGVLLADVISVEWKYPHDDFGFKSNYLQDPGNYGILKFNVLPKDHDREHYIHIPFKIVIAPDGTVNLSESKGLKDLHMVLEQYGLKNAGFNINGQFEDEEGNIVEPVDVPYWILSIFEVNQTVKFLVYVYKEDWNGKTIFKCSRFLYPNTEEGAKQAEYGLEKQLEYLEAKSNIPAQQATPIPQTQTSPKTTGPRRI